jgi:phosphoribosylformylglycinamidine cyclo-ligase
MPVRRPITYSDAGHDLDRSDRIVARLKRRLPDIGGFGGIFPLPKGRWKEPVLVSGTDGVGTKLLVAIKANRHDTVGIDLVAMVVNDIVTLGAQPIFFLDYIAAGKLDPKVIETIITGIVEGCEQAGCRLLGGETAEMPGMYPKGHYDLAGFGVGVAERKALVEGKTIRPGDVVIGLESSGLHSNGYSLARAVVFERCGLTVGRRVARLGSTVADALLTPTRIYVPVVLDLMRRFEIKGMANITGGGLPGNLNRVLPPNCDARIAADSWPRPPIFGFLQQNGPVEEAEMFRAFNMGIGYTLVVPASQASAVVRRSAKVGFPAHAIGRIIRGSAAVRLI